MRAYSFRSRYTFVCIIVLLFASLSACNSRGASGQLGASTPKEKPVATPTASNFSRPTINLYVETSGSMTGYINQPSEFKDILSSILTDIKTRDVSDKINIGFVADHVCIPKPNANSTDIDYFIKNLNPVTVAKFKCGSGSSDFTQILREITKSTENSINIIASDCILSLKDGKTSDYFGQYENSIKLLFSDSLKVKPFSTLIVKYYSSFNGIYYNESPPKPNPNLVNKGIKRPFYLIVVGASNQIRNLIEKIKFSKYAPDAETYLLQPASATPVQAKMLRLPRQGEYAIKIPATSLQLEKAVLGGRDGQVKRFQFSIALNLSSFSMDTSYINNPSNYRVSGNYTIDSIKAINGTQSPELADYTHIFSLSTTDLKESQDVQIDLVNRVPNWVASSSSINDANIFDSQQQLRTFGLQYLIEGIAGAYNDRFNMDKQFSVTVKVTKGEATASSPAKGFNWWILVAAIGLVVIIIWIKNK